MNKISLLYEFLLELSLSLCITVGSVDEVDNNTVSINIYSRITWQRIQLVYWANCRWYGTEGDCHHYHENAPFWQRQQFYSVALVANKRPVKCKVPVCVFHSWHLGQKLWYLVSRRFGNHQEQKPKPVFVFLPR